MSIEKIKIDKATLEAIEKTLSKGDRVELIPVKNGLKVMQVKRKEICKTGEDNVRTNEFLDWYNDYVAKCYQNSQIIEQNGKINKNDVIC